MPRDPDGPRFINYNRRRREKTAVPMTRHQALMAFLILLAVVCAATAVVVALFF